ncbi:hypothetical protein HispidOSU_027637, partial [Sigmodon hispidus]
MGVGVVSKAAAKREKKRPESSVETQGHGMGAPWLPTGGQGGCVAPAHAHAHAPLQRATYLPAPGSGRKAATLMAFLKLQHQ